MILVWKYLGVTYTSFFYEPFLQCFKPLYLFIFFQEDKYRKNKASISGSIRQGTACTIQFFISQHETEQVGPLCNSDPILSLVRKLKPLNTVNHPLFAWGICIDIQHYRSPWPLSEQKIKWSGLFALAGVKAMNMSKMTDWNAWEWKDKCLTSARAKSTITIDMFDNS